MVLRAVRWHNRPPGLHLTSANAQSYVWHTRPKKPFQAFSCCKAFALVGL